VISLPLLLSRSHPGAQVSSAPDSQFSGARGKDCMLITDGKASQAAIFDRIGSMARKSSRMLAIGALLAGGSFFVSSASAQTPGQLTFDTPELAVKALVAASKDENRVALEKIFGSDYSQLLSGDPVEDKQDLDNFTAAIQQSVQLQQVDATKYTVTAGNFEWPAPIPVVQKDGKWFFDTKSGVDVIMDRRVGENEFSAIETCRAYAMAQWEYFTQGDWDHDGVAEYAKRIISTPGKHDGLYWETDDDENQSPLGASVAAAQVRAAEAAAANPGPAPKPVATKSMLPKTAASPTDAKESAEIETLSLPYTPYHGYYFKILTAQGPYAPGGKYSYIINGNMIAGYALVAYPSKWSVTGVMTFIINQQGRVYEKNLGSDTDKLAAAMTAYNPDPSWKLVEVQP
jgi:Protein of unknown function (DUF2950)